MKQLLLLVLILSSISSFSQNEKLVLTLNDFQVFKTIDLNTYKVVNSKNNIVLKDLKYVNNAGNSSNLQVLDANNDMTYYNDSLEKVLLPEVGYNRFCGTVA